MSTMSLQFTHIYYLACRYEHTKDKFHAKCPHETDLLKTQSQTIQWFYQRPTVTCLNPLSIPENCIFISQTEFHTRNSIIDYIKQIKFNLLTNPEYKDYLQTKETLKQAIIYSLNNGNTAEEIEHELTSSYDKALQQQTLAKVRKIALIEVKPKFVVNMSCI
jgi:hypothetical protein